MPKSGEPYEDLVGTVAQALDRDAKVSTGEWTDGPDGRRDMDVSVRGTADGKPKFILIECKDWARPVGISTVDALDSKRKDLNATSAIIYSNSGFTGPALRKSARVGIETVSALATGDGRVRIQLHRELVAKKKAVRYATLRLWTADDENDARIPENYGLYSVTFAGHPLANWLHNVSGDLLKKCNESCTIHGKYALKKFTEFSVDGSPVLLKGFGFRLTCTVGFVSQIVRADVSLGHFNHATGRISVPPQQFYSMGMIDNEAWKETDSSWAEPWQMAPRSFGLRLTMFAPVPMLDGTETPNLDDVISEAEIKIEPAEGAA